MLGPKNFAKFFLIISTSSTAVYCAFFIISMWVGIDKNKINFENVWNNFFPLILKIDKKNHISLPGTVLPCISLFSPRNCTLRICNSLFSPRNCTSQKRSLDYSRVRNKRSPTIIKFLTFFQGLRPYSGLHSIR